MPFDLAIVGGGGAGLSLLLAIDRAVAAGTLARPDIVLVDPVQKAGNDRTWCWWAGPDDPLGPLLHCSWPRMELVGADGRAREYALEPKRYVMLRSADLYSEADRAVERLGVSRVRAGCDRLTGTEHDVRISAGGHDLTATWAFDSRPAPPSRPGGTFLLQHFRGWTARFDAPVLRPGVATLMDFGVPQPAGGVAFSYCLPLSEQVALVEYTEFSPARLEPAGYERALKDYLRLRHPGVGYQVLDVEDGAIPMTDAPFPRRTGRRTFRLGTSGGATRPSTGYTFAAMQRQAAGVVRALERGDEPLPPRPYPPRHRWMDAVLLRALRTGGIDGPDLFTGLFAANRPERVIRFLDGVSGPGDDLAVMRSAPPWPMVRAGAADAGGRLVRLMLRSVGASNQK